MSIFNTRRRVLAAFAALGGGALLAPSAARAETYPCQLSFREGTETNGQTNYLATAEEATFAFVADMRAVGDEIELYNPQWGQGRKEAHAGIKGRIVRNPDGTFGANMVSFEFPYTALSRGGAFYAITQMAFDQNVPVGLDFVSGPASFGSFIFEKGKFDPNSTSQGFEGSAAGSLHGALMSGARFEANLVVDGTIYSSIIPVTANYRSFIEDVLIPQMNAAQAKDRDSPCYYIGDGYEDLYDCFLTSACCTVIGLKDRCWELETLRQFRDGWLSSFAEGRADIARYYAEAPEIARRLVSSSTGRARLLRLYWGTIVPSAVCARLGLNRMAYRLYRRMMTGLLDRPT